LASEEDPKILLCSKEIEGNLLPKQRGEETKDLPVLLHVDNERSYQAHHLTKLTKYPS
jgi:hypothetical protein